MRGQQGFTLLELLVALAVFATLAAAGVSAAQWSVLSQQRLEARWFASIALDNHLQLLSLEPESPRANSIALTFAGKQWRLEQRLEASGAHTLSVSEASSGERLAYWSSHADE